MKKNQIAALILIIVVAAGIVVASSTIKTTPQTGNNPSANLTQTADNGSADSAVQATNNADKVAYAAVTDSKKEIFTNDINNSSAKMIFTDSDESDKIKSIGGISNNNKILALFAPANQEFVGNLYEISLTEAGKSTKIADNFASSGIPKISPDGKKISYTLYSNAETDFGYKLIVSNIDGTSKKQLDNNDDNISIYGWSPDSAKVLYSKGSYEDETKLYYADTNSLKLSDLISIKGQIFNISWGANDIFVLNMKEKNKPLNSTELYKFTFKKLKLEQITDNKLFEDFPIISPDGQKIMYFCADYGSGKIDIFKNGDINIANIDGKSAKKIGDGNLPIGWVNE